MAGLRSSSYGNNNTDSSVINQLCRRVGHYSAIYYHRFDQNFQGNRPNPTQTGGYQGQGRGTNAGNTIQGQFQNTFPILDKSKLSLRGDIKDTPICNIVQTVQAVSCNTGSHRYTNIDSVATQSQVSAVTSSSKVQGLYNEQAEQCYTRRDDTKYHKSDRRMVAADVQVEAADTSWSKCVASHDCRFSSPG
ncbi:hypothetical protein ACOSP7_031774 [Xanthoceras sorbifolium]